MSCTPRAPVGTVLGAFVGLALICGCTASTPSGSELCDRASASAPASFIPASAMASGSSSSAASVLPELQPLAPKRGAAPAGPPPREWAALPADSRVLVFRDLYLGALPYPSRRNTWTLVLLDGSARVRFESAQAKSSFQELDRSSHDANAWSVTSRLEYEGTLVGQPPRSLQLKLIAGGEAPAPGQVPTVPLELRMACAEQSIDVHPAFVTLVPGWKYDDDSMEPATWAPARTQRERALLCKLEAEPSLLLPFTTGLAFVPAKKADRLDAVGVEWAFNNSDMVLQQGGYRYLPASAGPF